MLAGRKRLKFPRELLILVVSALVVAALCGLYVLLNRQAGPETRQPELGQPTGLGNALTPPSS